MTAKRAIIKMHLRTIFQANVQAAIIPKPGQVPFSVIQQSMQQAVPIAISMMPPGIITMASVPTAIIQVDGEMCHSGMRVLLTAAHAMPAGRHQITIMANAQAATPPAAGKEQYRHMKDSLTVMHAIVTRHHPITTLDNARIAMRLEEVGQITALIIPGIQIAAHAMAILPQKIITMVNVPSAILQMAGQERFSIIQD